MLMALGLAYDSDGGARGPPRSPRCSPGTRTRSRPYAARMGPFAGYAANSEHMLRVLDMHRQEAAHIDEELVPAEVLSAAQQAWDNACDLATTFGVRKLAGQCLGADWDDRPAHGLRHHGHRARPRAREDEEARRWRHDVDRHQTIPRALTRLGYTDAQIDDIVAYIAEQKSILGAPHLAAEHVSVFACSMGDNTIHYSDTCG